MMGESILRGVILVLLLGLISADDNCPSGCTCNNRAMLCESISGDQISGILAGFRSPMEGLILSKFTAESLTADMFQSIPFLKNLVVVESPKVSSVDENAFQGLNSIESIVIKGTSVSSLPENVFNPVKNTLEYLELMDNKVTKLPPDIFKGMRVLRTIDLSGNPLKLPPVDALSQPGLNRTAVRLKDNDIPCEPCTPSMKALASLINDKGFPILAECTPSQPSTGKNLIKLKCNELTAMKPTTSAYTSTQKPVKNPSNCPTKCRCDGRSVRCDSVFANEFENIMSSLTPSNGNETFVLNNFVGGKIKTGSFRSISYIKHLAIINSPELTTIDPDALVGLRNLESLFIDTTSISDIPENLFIPVRTSLKFLELPNNKLTTLHDKTFEGMEVLRMIDLDGNPLKLPSVKVFNHPNLNRTVVHLKENNISCDDCTPSIVEMLSLIYDAHFPIRAQCTSPKKFAGKFITDLRCDKTTTEATTTLPISMTMEAVPTTEIMSTTEAPTSTQVVVPQSDGCPQKCSCMNKAVRCDSVTTAELDDIIATLKLTNDTESFILNDFRSSEIERRTFSGISHVKQLTIMNSPDLTTMDSAALSGLEELKSLFINATSIDDLPENLFTPVNTTLKFLQLTNNKLTTLHEKTFSEMQTLQMIDLSGNPLQLPPTAVFNYPNLQRTAIRLWNNDIPCDPCTLNIVQTELLIKEQNYPISVECTAPEKFAGKKLEYLEKTDLNCDDILAQLAPVTTTWAPSTPKFTTSQPTTTIPKQITTATTTVSPQTTTAPIKSTITSPTTRTITTEKSTTERKTTTETVTTSTTMRPTTVENNNNLPTPTCPQKCTCSENAVECHEINEEELLKITSQMSKKIKSFTIKRYKTSNIGEDLLRNIPDINQISFRESPQITAIAENAFQSLKSCEAIILLNTHITKLPEKLFLPVAGHLRFLDLMDNKITSLYKTTFVGMKNLKTVDLSGNPLKAPSRQTFAYEELSRTKIRLHQNDITCVPCTPPIVGLLDLIHNHSYPISVECTAPKEVAGRRLENLNLTDLHCDQVFAVTTMKSPLSTPSTSSTGNFNYTWIIIAAAVTIALLIGFGILREFRKHKYQLIKDRENDFFSLDEDDDEGSDTAINGDAAYGDPYDELPLLEVNSNFRKSLRDENVKLV